VGFALGGDANGFTIDISASAARGKADGTDETHSNTHVAAGKTLTIQSGTDTTLKGAVASGGQVVANIGGNLNLESLQDTTTFDSKQESAGFSVSLCIPPICYGSGSFSANYAKAGVKGDFASVTEQTGIKAGDGGFQVNVGGNTDLKGAVVTSTQAAVDAKSNSLTTGSLSASSIDNHDVFKATSVSVSGGTGGGSGAAYQKSGDQRSVTESGISDAALNVAGTSTGNVDTTVRTDVDSSASLGKAWDGQKLQEQVTAGASVIAQFGSTASKLVGDYASSKTKPLEDARKYEELQQRQANGESISEKDATWIAKMDQAGYSIEQAKAIQSNPEVLRDYEDWKEGGQYRVAAHAAVGALSGNLQGALGAAASAAAVPGVADAINELGLPEPLRKSVIALAGTAVGAAVGGGSGAAAGFNQTTNNYLKHEQWDELAKKLGACKSNAACEKEVNAEYARLSHLQDMALATCDVRGDCGTLQAEVKEGAVRQMDLIKTGALSQNYAGAANFQSLGEKLARNPQLRSQVAQAVTAKYVCDTNPAKCDRDAAIAATALLGTVVGGPVAGRLLAGLAASGPEIAAAGKVALDACLANLVLCMNKAGIAGAELAAGDALGGTAIAGGVVGGSKVLADGKSYLNNATAPEIRTRFVSAAEQLREGIPFGGNIGIAEVNVQAFSAQPAVLKAHSAVNESVSEMADWLSKPKGDLTSWTLKPQVSTAQHLNTPSGYLRDTDTEFKILEHISSTISGTANPSGTINLFSEKLVCPSCTRVVRDFRDMYPGIQLNVFTKQEKPFK
jgi:hypothetical protein